MKELKTSPDESEVVNSDSEILIHKNLKERLAAVKEMSKSPLSLQQMREQIKKHHADADRVWKQGKSDKAE